MSKVTLRESLRYALGIEWNFDLLLDYPEWADKVNGARVSIKYWIRRAWFDICATPTNPYK